MYAPLFNPHSGCEEYRQNAYHPTWRAQQYPNPPFSYPDFDGSARRTIKTSLGLWGYHDDYISITGSANSLSASAEHWPAQDYFKVLECAACILTYSLNHLQKPANTQGHRSRGSELQPLWRESLRRRSRNHRRKTIQLRLHRPHNCGHRTRRKFHGCKSGLRTGYHFLPLAADGQDLQGNDRMDTRGVPWINVLGVLRPDHRSASGRQQLNLLQCSACLHSIQPGFTVERIQVPTDPLAAFAISAPTSTWRARCTDSAHVGHVAAATGVPPMLPTCYLVFAVFSGAASRIYDPHFHWAPGAGRWCASSWLENLLASLVAGGRRPLLH